MNMSNRTGTVTLLVTQGRTARTLVTISETTVEAVLPKDRNAAKAIAKMAGVELDAGQVVTVLHAGYAFGLTPSDLR